MDHQTCYRIDPTRAAGSRCHVIPVDPLLPRPSESLSSLSLSRLAPVLVSDIRSPSSLSSDFDDHLSHRSLSTSSLSHSGATTPTKSSPERFLFFESEESDHDWGHPVPNGEGDAHYMQFRGVPHKGKRMGRTGSGWGSSSDFEDANDALQPFPGSKNHRVKATKLWYYAQTSSPPVGSSEHKPISLIVSIPLLSLPSGSTNSSLRQRRPTALSHFATKKRALAHSPSLDSSNDMAPVSMTNYPAEYRELGQELCRGNPLASAANTTGKVGKNSKKKLAKGKAKLSAKNNVVLDSKREIPNRLDLPLMSVRPPDTPTSVAEDDEMSVASSNTTTTTASSSNSMGPGSKTNSRADRTRGCSSSKMGTGGSQNNSSLLGRDSGFSLASLFSYYPPTLTVRDGELVPEKSLSIKNVDRFSLPSSHPIAHWSLGQPVRGTWSSASAPAKQKRPRKSTISSSKT